MLELQINIWNPFANSYIILKKYEVRNLGTWVDEIFIWDAKKKYGKH